MVSLRRHQLVRLIDDGWTALHSQGTDDVSRACLMHWAQHGAPLVVTQQCRNLPQDCIAVGLPAPPQWERRRLALKLPRAHVLAADAFPAADAVAELLPPPLQPAWRDWVQALQAMGTTPRVYGSFGWQLLTGLPYLRAESDLDLLLTVADPAMADAAAALLSQPPFEAPRLDGELVFPDGSAVAWREWRQWRAGRVDRVLVKRLHGVAMEADDAWLGEHLPC
jgi:phosphoribosyl-dephospho-CoA transferase